MVSALGVCRNNTQQNRVLSNIIRKVGTRYDGILEEKEIIFNVDELNYTLRKWNLSCVFFYWGVIDI